jgi:hypothetical protein
VPSALFLEYHENKRRIGASTRMNNTHFEQFLKNFLNFILLGKGMTIRENIGRKISWYERNGMIMDAKWEAGSPWGVVKITWCWESIDWRSRCTKGVSTN